MTAELPSTIADAAAALRSGTLTSAALTTELLARTDALDETLGTYVSRFDDSALVAAAQADADFAAGIDRGPLQGIPIAVKDIIAARAGATTACSKVLDRDWGRGTDAPVVARLRAEGAVITGKTATMEFAMGAPDADGPFPIHRNPWDLDRWPGGSSAGTGTGVSAGLILGGLGSDTGGSVRIPAALCGISGLKPSYGLVPKSGVVPLGYSLDTVGPMARTARDCALILQTIAGESADDPTSVDRPVPRARARGRGDRRGALRRLSDHQRRRDGDERGRIPRVPPRRPSEALRRLRARGARLAHAGRLLQLRRLRTSAARARVGTRHTAASAR